MADFDLAGARQHYQDSQIADYLGTSRGFDTAGARKAGFSDQQIIDHVMGMQSKAAPAAPKAAAAPAQPQDTSEHTFLGDLGHNALGALEQAGAAVANIPGGIANAGADFAARATGHTGGWHPIPMVHAGKAGQDFAEQGSQLLEQGLDKIGVGDAVAKGVGATDEAVRSAAANHPGLANGLAATGDVAAIAGMRGMPIAEGLPTVPGAVSRAVRGVTTAAGDDAAAAAQTARQAGYQQAGFKTAGGNKVGSAIAGDTAVPAKINHNADVFNSYSGAEANVPHGTPLSYESLEAGRTAPNGVVERVGRALPEGHLDGPAQIRVNNAGSTITDAASQQQVANMRQALLQPMTGEQRMQQLRQYRQEAYSRIGNEGANSTDQQAVGRAQLDMANAIEDHIGRNLPQNGDVSLEQYQQARKTLAKNYTVQQALRGTDVDPNVLARIQRADPQLLDGHMENMANFANENREVVGLPKREGAPSVSGDVANVNPLKLGNLASLATAGLGPALGRRIITGGSAAGRATARARTPGAGLGDEFAPLTPRPPQPPEGMAVAGEGAGGPHGPPPGNNSDLASVMSHGVEQPPPPGLTAGPMGAPPGEGIPFQRNAGHEAGDLSLGDMVADLHRTYGSNSDLPGVMSQGVPEGTMARTAPGARGTRSNRGPGTRLGDVLTNNASGESSASQEAINRGSRDLVQVDPDGNPTPVMRGVDQIDRRSPKGHLIVDRSSGEIIDRGGLNKQMAEGLRNRWASRVRLGDNFAPPRE